VTDDDRFKLLFGPYKAPRLRYGDAVLCELRGEAVVCGRTAGPIPWPLARRKERSPGAPFVVVCGALAEAVRRESALAVAHWFGLSAPTVRALRKALGVPRSNEGSARLYARNGEARRKPVEDDPRVPRMRRLRERGLPRKEIARRLGVSGTTVWRRIGPGRPPRPAT
jgi:hypothetical protein